MDTLPLWQTHFPQLATQADPALARLRSQARLVELPPGQAVFHAGGTCESYLLMIDGRVRVQVIGEGGREVVLYRVLPGQSCVMTTSCLLAGESYPAEGHTETQAQAFAIPRKAFEEALDTSPAFRRFVFGNLGGRLAEVILRMESVVFQPIDRRLAECILARAGSAPAIAATHQDLAAELGSAREVVSRHLKRLESQGLVRLGRAAVEIADRPRLEGLARKPV